MNIQRKKLKTFFIFLILTDLFAYLLSYSGVFSGHAVASYMMILPATGVSLSIYIYEKKKLNYLNYIMLASFIIFSLLILVYIIFRTTGIIKFDFPNALIHVIGYIPSLAIFAYALINSGDKNDELNILKNFKKSLMYLIIFIFFWFILIIVFKIKVINIEFIFQFIISMVDILGIIVMIIFFIGEEYAWRGYLQDIFQNKFGKRLGVILLGILWETWHFPIWHSYYNVDIYGNIIRYIYVISIGIFIGYAYMKTRNIFLCAIIHCANNLLCGFSDILELNKEVLFINSNAGYLMLGISVISFMFIFKKDYNNNRNVIKKIKRDLNHET